MSKFIDKLKRLSQGVPESIGFRPSQLILPKPRIQLLAVLSPEPPDHIAEVVAGADAVVFPTTQINPKTSYLAKIARALVSIPWGIRYESGQPDVAELIKTGGDFVVFSAAKTPLTTVVGDNIGKILEVEPSLNEGLLRAVNELPVDAVLVAGELKTVDTITWQHLMLFQRFADLLTKPLLVSIPPSVDAGTLQALWEAGVNGLVISAVGSPKGKIKELRKIIDGLPFPVPHHWERIEPILPRISAEPSQITAEEEEEEEE
ncbi:MAG: hypothetical protein CL877_03785 [Dehalococcoidales bacterium]|jgi:hypothetical protein|nr:hypothetical protein [Dehalococcoidales bacterium]MDP6221955.1 hypothetical protein [Dehalococcoidales bacterium]MDP7109497.1 hypothetical protein [Dehalococcoidales bacterium]MDP7310024.1 hypothetical protein [Dehalococcoidales bacterium]MDP7410043.1 hypothetical protein [Dehalococcoidales bacterium]|tara:strand:+ start:253 stop:1035 length:783 start_codon:yes stop_codon:yes gene_type:complete